MIAIYYIIHRDIVIALHIGEHMPYISSLGTLTIIGGPKLKTVLINTRVNINIIEFDCVEFALYKLS